MSVVYVSPAGSGDQSGSSKANAAPITSLNTMIHQAGDGGTVVLAADEGAYTITKSLTITGSGVTITATNRDGSSGAAVFEGNRPENWTPGQPTGNELFRIDAGADHLVFENMEFVNTGTAIRVTGDIEDLTIRDMQATNVRRFFEDLASGGDTATIDGLVIRNVDVAGFSKNAIRLQYDTHDVLIEDVRGDSQQQDGDSFAMGVHLEDTVHDVVFRRVTMENALQTREPGEYWNGDGFASERGTYGIRFEDTVARGNSDGGYDIKSSDVVFDNALAEGNGRNYRLWGDDIVVRNSVGRDPDVLGGTSSQGQVWVGTNGDVRVIGSRFEDAGASTVVFENDGGTLRIIDTEVEMADGARLTKGPVMGVSEDNVDRVEAVGESSYNPDAVEPGEGGLLPGLVELLEGVLGDGADLLGNLFGQSHALRTLDDGSPGTGGYKSSPAKDATLGYDVVHDTSRSAEDLAAQMDSLLGSDRGPVRAATTEAGLAVPSGEVAFLPGAPDELAGQLATMFDAGASVSDNYIYNRDTSGHSLAIPFA